MIKKKPFLMVFSFSLKCYNESGGNMFENAIEVLKLIEKKGFKAYIVGGYVRDIYLSNTSTDIDICTSAKPKDLVKIFKKNTSK